ncbi:lysozyme inhibitor LprI family protein [Butyrivibrio sp. JL13D10]|uniref:lysozyme inhibitor LprI family protein n=1 Tax=Butyrivibrio sp. JL13D10 TaxID=3236815 RepID=UPI0038B50276
MKEMNRFKAILPIIGICTLVAGCTPTQQSGADDGLFQNQTENEQAAAESEAEAENSDSSAGGEETAQDSQSEKAEAAEGDNGGAPESTDGQVPESLSKVVAGDGKISLDFYNNNILKNVDYPSDIEELIQLVPADKEYSLSELMAEFNKTFNDENNYFQHGDITGAEYAYLDCGSDGVKELAIRLTGPFVEQEGEATLILKDIEGKAQIVYGFENWSRSFTEINNCGLISGSGSNGASNHGVDMSIIDADGNYRFGYYEEQEYDLDSFAMMREHDEFDASSLDGAICIYTLRLSDYQDEGSDQDWYYSYEVVDKENYEKIDVPNLYTDSEYKKIMDSFKEYSFISMDELEKVKAEKLSSLGVTDEIMNAMGPSFEPVDPAVTGFTSAAVETAPEEKVVKDAEPIVDDGSVQSEIAMVEAKHQEYENLDWEAMPQQEMNITSYEMFELWDNELNSVWSKLTEEVTPEKKEELLKDQREWIKRKEAAVKEAGSEALGGTLQPLLENGTGWSYTRKRVYYLAGVLAETRGESFEVPAEVEESFKDIDQ